MFCFCFDCELLLLVTLETSYLICYLIFLHGSHCIFSPIESVLVCFLFVPIKNEELGFNVDTLLSSI